MTFFSRAALLAGSTALALWMPPRAVEAQQTDALPSDTVPAAQAVDTVPGDRLPAEQLQPGDEAGILAGTAEVGRVGPGGAFWRSILIPGWGHAVVGATTRGAFYFAAAAGVGYMAFKSASNRSTAQRIRDNRAEMVAKRLLAQGTPEDSIRILVPEDESVIEAQELVQTRSDQVQDWVALGLFLALLSGADAFVSAHLIDFPEPLQIEPLPAGGVELGIRVPDPFR